MGCSTSGYYSWRKRKPSGRDLEEYRLIGMIEKIHLGSRATYGSPRVHAIMSGMGEYCSKTKVERLMRKYGIKAKTKRKYKATTNSKHKLPVADNVLQREFNPKEVNTAWAGDITYIWTDEGWLYLAVVVDLFSRKVIGWPMERHMNKSLVQDAFLMAARKRKLKENTIFHSDRGSQYASIDYQETLEHFQFICSMSRKANCWDNAVVESFFGTLKSENTSFCRFKTREEAKQNIFEWIEVFYNRERIHSSLGFKSPMEYEELSKLA